MPTTPIKLEEVRRKPDKDLIACCRDLLKRAESGDLQSLIYLATGTDTWDSGNVGKLYDRATQLGRIFMMGMDYYTRRRAADPPTKVVPPEDT